MAARGGAGKTGVQDPCAGEPFRGHMADMNGAQ
jgi:hypothetical protein